MYRIKKSFRERRTVPKREPPEGRMRKTKEFESLRCSDEGRYLNCELMKENQVVEEVKVEEIQTRNERSGNSITHVDNINYNDIFSMVFDKPTKGEIENANLRIELN